VILALKLLAFVFGWVTDGALWTLGLVLLFLNRLSVSGSLSSAVALFYLSAEPHDVSHLTARLSPDLVGFNGVIVEVRGPHAFSSPGGKLAVIREGG